MRAVTVRPSPSGCRQGGGGGERRRTLRLCVWEERGILAGERAGGVRLNSSTQGLVKGEGQHLIH